MSELLQFAQHPDADQLTAFAEHALPLHEREQTLAHLATCTACRQLVFLAQEAEPVPAARPAAARPVAARTAWFAGWHLVWPAALALAGIVLFSVHLRHATPGVVEKREVAIVTEAPPIPAAPTLAPEVHSKVAAPAAKPMPSAVMKLPEVAAPGLGASGINLNGGMPQQGAAVQAQDQQFPGMARNRDKTPSVPPHGPMAMQQQMVAPAPPPASTQKMAQSQVSLAQALPPLPAPPKPAAAMAGMGVARMPAPAPPPPPVGVTLGETVRAGAAAAPAPVARKAAPPAAAQGAATQTVTVDAMSDMAVTSGASLDAASAAGAMLTELPSGKTTVSKVSNGSRTVALDGAGAVFFSKDGGRHWTAVKAQWPGRAVQVSLKGDSAPQVRARNGYSLAAKSARGLSIVHDASVDGTHAQIAGSVTDATGAVISGAMIRVKNAAGAEVSSVRADKNGSFTTGALDPGKYVVQISAPGFATFVQALELQARDRASLGAALVVAAESETVTVSAAQDRVAVAKPKAEPFTLITDAGATWTSKDGQKWKRQ